MNLYVLTAKNWKLEAVTISTTVRVRVLDTQMTINLSFSYFLNYKNKLINFVNMPASTQNFRITNSRYELVGAYC